MSDAPASAPCRAPCTCSQLLLPVIKYARAERRSRIVVCRWRRRCESKKRNSRRPTTLDLRRERALFRKGQTTLAAQSSQIFHLSAETRLCNTCRKTESPSASGKFTKDLFFRSITHTCSSSTLLAFLAWSICP